MRRFQMIHLCDLREESMERIFSQILSGYLSQSTKTKILMQDGQKIIQSSISLYCSILEKLLPIPAKCHYNFNMRDLSKVF